MKEVSIIIPTYREALNLKELIPQISHVIRQDDMDFEIIVVDDDSRDGTKELCDILCRDYPLRLLQRTEERGLATAVIAGMKIAEGQYFVVMDADFSHPPENIPDLLEQIRKPQYDFVIGSRYVSGGSTFEGWSLFRKLNSGIATLLARPLTKSADPMAGFFALRKLTFEKAARHLDPIGYKIGLELIVKGDCQSVAEVPIHFSSRLHGESKLSFSEQCRYFLHLKRLYFYRFDRFASFAMFSLVGLSGSIIDLLSFSLFLTFLPFASARAVAIWIAMTWNFTWNRKFTFINAEKYPIFNQYLRFCGSCLTGAVANWLTSLALCKSHAFFTEHPLVPAVFGIIAGTALNFTLCRLIVFKGKRIFEN